VIFRNSNLAANTMAKNLCIIGINKIKVLVFNSDSEEEFTSNDSDIECAHDMINISASYS
jgi:hypothetical protein